MDYPYIRAWGRLLHSFPYYVEGEIEDARRSKAPPDAIYSRSDGTWRTYRDITSDETRATVDRLLAALEAGQ